MRILVTGGVRSGKSAHAERLLADAASVTYVATGAIPGADPAWADRVQAHRARRPDHWVTVETGDLVTVFGWIPPGGAALVDSLGTWLTSRLDNLDAWHTPRREWETRLMAEIEAAIAVVPGNTVLVTDEVGLGGVAAHEGARLFADLLGEVNQRFAAVCAEVHLVVAGRVLRLS